jgi:hypothetical protein
VTEYHHQAYADDGGFLGAHLRIDRDGALMVRGHGQFEAADFDISACYSERGQALLGSRE